MFFCNSWIWRRISNTRLHLTSTVFITQWWLSICSSHVAFTLLRLHLPPSACWDHLLSPATMSQIGGYSGWIWIDGTEYKWSGPTLFLFPQSFFSIFTCSVAIFPTISTAFYIELVWSQIAFTSLPLSLSLVFYRFKPVLSPFFFRSRVSLSFILFIALSLCSKYAIGFSLQHDF